VRRMPVNPLMVPFRKMSNQPPEVCTGTFTLSNRCSSLIEDQYSSQD